MVPAGAVTYPGYTPTPITGAPVALTANRAFAATDVGRIISLAGYALNLTAGSVTAQGGFFVRGPGSITGALGSITVAADRSLHILFSPALGFDLVGDDRVKNNYSATAAPGVGNDNTQGYGPGSVWIDTVAKEAYHCVDAATGAALWVVGTLSVAEVAAMLEDKLDATTAAVALMLEADPALMRQALGNVALLSDCEFSGEVIVSDAITILDGTHMGAILRNLSGSAKTLFLGSPTGAMAGKTFAVAGPWNFSVNQPQGPVGTVTSVPGGTHIIRAIGLGWVIQTATANQFIPASQNGDLTVEVAFTEYGEYTLTNADKGKMLIFDEAANLYATVADLSAVFNVGILARGGAVTLVVTGDLNGVTTGTGVIPQGYEPTSIFKAVSELVATGSIGAITEFTP